MLQNDPHTRPKQQNSSTVLCWIFVAVVTISLVVNVISLSSTSSYLGMHSSKIVIIIFIFDFMVTSHNNYPQDMQESMHQQVGYIH